MAHCQCSCLLITGLTLQLEIILQGGFPSSLAVGANPFKHPSEQGEEIFNPCTLLWLGPFVKINKVTKQSAD